jgi:hypothetical protein
MGTAGGNGFLNTTVPIWPAAPARYVFLRRVVQLDTTPARKGIIHATAFVAAAQDGDKEKLLGAYRLHVNGRPAAIGSGRGEVNYAMKNHILYDSLDLTAAAQAAAEASAAARGLLTLALQCYHHDATGQVGVLSREMCACIWGSVLVCLGRSILHTRGSVLGTCWMSG